MKELSQVQALILQSSSILSSPLDGGDGGDGGPFGRAINRWRPVEPLPDLVVEREIPHHMNSE